MLDDEVGKLIAHHAVKIARQIRVILNKELIATLKVNGLDDQKILIHLGIAAVSTIATDFMSMALQCSSYDMQYLSDKFDELFWAQMLDAAKQLLEKQENKNV